MMQAIKKVLANVEQLLSSDEKAQARDNIGAASQAALDDAILAEVTSAVTEKRNNTNYIDFRNSQGTILFSLNSDAFVKDGMVDSVEVKDVVIGGETKTCLVITFNTDAGNEDINVPIGDIFDAGNYYTKTATDSLLAGKVDKETGKGLSANDFTNSYKSQVDFNTSERHTHANKQVLDGIDTAKVSSWDGKQDELHSASLSDIGDNFRAGDHILIAYTESDKKLKYKTIDAVWTFIKNKISSVLGLTASSYGGNAASATVADSANSVAWANVTGMPDQIGQLVKFTCQYNSQIDSPNFGEISASELKEAITSGKCVEIHGGVSGTESITVRMVKYKPDGSFAFFTGMGPYDSTISELTGYGVVAIWNNNTSTYSWDSWRFQMPTLDANGRVISVANSALTAVRSAYLGSSQVGGPNQPIYINSDGEAKACSNKLIVGTIGTDANTVYLY